jgi:hypothetical protein
LTAIFDGEGFEHPEIKAQGLEVSLSETDREKMRRKAALVNKNWAQILKIFTEKVGFLIKAIESLMHPCLAGRNDRQFPCAIRVQIWGENCTRNVIAQNILSFCRTLQTLENTRKTP